MPDEDQLPGLNRDDHVRSADYEISKRLCLYVTLHGGIPGNQRKSHVIDLPKFGSLVFFLLFEFGRTINNGENIQ